jgi:hypothetical protein
MIENVDMIVVIRVWECSCLHIFNNLQEVDFFINPFRSKLVTVPTVLERMTPGCDVKSWPTTGIFSLLHLWRKKCSIFVNFIDFR